MPYTELEQFKHEVRHGLIGAYSEYRKSLEGLSRIADLIHNDVFEMDPKALDTALSKQLGCAWRMKQHLTRMLTACQAQGKAEEAIDSSGGRT